MIHVDFKTYKHWDNSNTATDEISISKVKPIELYEYLKKANKQLQGGFCISILGKAWNGYWDDEEDSYLYYIDHISGALSLLRTINYFNSPHALIGETRNEIWQCDGSTMELSLIGPDQIMLKDEVFECEEIVTSLRFLSLGFQKASKDLRNCLENVLAICSQEDSITHEIESYLEEMEKYAVT